MAAGALLYSLQTTGPRQTWTGRFLCSKRDDSPVRHVHGSRLAMGSDNDYFFPAPGSASLDGGCPAYSAASSPHRPDLDVRYADTSFPTHYGAVVPVLRSLVFRAAVQAFRRIVTAVNSPNGTARDLVHHDQHPTRVRRPSINSAT